MINVTRQSKYRFCYGRLSNYRLRLNISKDTPRQDELGPIFPKIKIGCLGVITYSYPLTDQADMPAVPRQKPETLKPAFVIIR